MWKSWDRVADCQDYLLIKLPYSISIHLFPAKLFDIQLMDSRIQIKVLAISIKSLDFGQVWSSLNRLLSIQHQHTVVCFHAFG